LWEITTASFNISSIPFNFKFGTVPILLVAH